MAGPWRFLIGFVGSVLAMLAAIALLLVALEGAGRLKAPSIANRASFDEKLRYLRAGGPRDVQVLITGSSTALHGIDGSALKEALGTERDILNVGVQGLSIEKSAYLTRFLIERLEGIEHVIAVTTTLDFEHCVLRQADFFDPEHAADYITGRRSEIYMQFRFLDLRGVFGRARDIRELRADAANLDSVRFDRYGSVLLDLTPNDVPAQVFEGRPLRFDPTCYQGLGALAHHLAGRGIAFTVVLAPLRPGYLANQDPDGSHLGAHVTRMRGALAGTRALFVDAHGRLALPETAFFDAYHVVPPEAAQLSRLIGSELRYRGAPQLDDVAEDSDGSAAATPSPMGRPLMSEPTGL